MRGEKGLGGACDLFEAVSKADPIDRRRLRRRAIYIPEGLTSVSPSRWRKTPRSNLQFARPRNPSKGNQHRANIIARLEFGVQSIVTAADIPDEWDARTSLAEITLPSAEETEDEGRRLRCWRRRQRGREEGSTTATREERHCRNSRKHTRDKHSVYGTIYSCIEARGCINAANIVEIDRQTRVHSVKGQLMLRREATG